ncbi:hypothetical protein VTP01DRAFT_642 [Rhizomucor pusillus]|uniref:uncharacterized protein n=1 Tax=Rhizomucor pusillus TaxID=4840 RepID=UPI003742B646
MFANDWAASPNGFSSPFDENPFASSPRNESFEQAPTSPSIPVEYSDSNGDQPQQRNAHGRYMTIRVSDPQKQAGSLGVGSYITYLITTETNVETFSSTTPRPVRRRFQDFVWLHRALLLEYPACVVPPLPEKNRIGYVNGGRFDEQFIEKRRLGLQWFLDRVSSHPYLQASQCTRIFLESVDFQNDKRVHEARFPDTGSLLESFGDALMNAFSKIQKPDQRFLDMKDYVDKFEDNLKHIEKLYSRISSRQEDLVQDYKNFAWSVREISAMESDIGLPLRQFAETTESYAKSMKDMTRKENILFMNDIHELLAYCAAVKQTLQKRDESQIDFEELSKFLQRAIEERERVGVNPVKIAELDTKIQELETEVARTSDITNGFSTQMTEEYEFFQRSKTAELKQSLSAYADSRIEFYSNGISQWEAILPVLERMDVAEDTIQETLK